jgi:hypothetical protein
MFFNSFLFSMNVLMLMLQWFKSELKSSFSINNKYNYEVRIVIPLLISLNFKRFFSLLVLNLILFLLINKTVIKFFVAYVLRTHRKGIVYICIPYKQLKDAHY